MMKPFLDWNDTQGIGLDLYDLGPQFTSPARLQNLLTMNGLHRYPADPDENIGGDTLGDKKGR